MRTSGGRHARRRSLAVPLIVAGGLAAAALAAVLVLTLAPRGGPGPADPGPSPAVPVGIVVTPLQHHRTAVVNLKVWAGETIIVYPSLPAYARTPPRVAGASHSSGSAGELGGG